MKSDSSLAPITLVNGTLWKWYSARGFPLTTLVSYIKRLAADIGRLLMLRFRNVSVGFTIEQLESWSFSFTEVIHISKSFGLSVTIGALFICRERERERTIRLLRSNSSPIRFRKEVITSCQPSLYMFINKTSRSQTYPLL